MSIVECLKWQTFSQAQEEQTSTEGKAGVPRFDGEVTKLAEYQFRVRLRQSRERAMDEAELKKLGPLGLRLIDGLRGPALQVARGLQVDKLSRDEGPTYLLQSLQAAFQPRSKQEARDLYQVGAQQGGILSRQAGESIPSYVLRRRTWYAMMTDLDGELKLPEPILAEQILQNSGISMDHQLLIRTAIRGEMTVAAVCEELVAQHSRIHEKETRFKVVGMANLPPSSRAMDMEKEKEIVALGLGSTTRKKKDKVIGVSLGTHTLRVWVAMKTMKLQHTMVKRNHPWTMTRRSMRPTR